MSGKILAVDCDLTTCPSDQGWLDWLNKRCTKYDPEIWKYWDSHSKLKLPYNLGEMFKEEVSDPYEYWRELEYDQFEPIEGSVKALEKLSQYFQIVFISSCKGNHHRSKVYWLKEHFPFMSGFMATKEKFLMNNSVAAMIDDRLDVLEKFDYHKRIQFQTPYEQSSKEKAYIEFDKWNDEIVHKICREYLK